MSECEKKLVVFVLLNVSLTLRDFECVLIFASSSRIRKINKRIISVSNLKEKIKKGKKIGVLFGPEASGLSNDEISCANYLVKIPSNKKFSSLNLSHSAIIFCFEIYQHFSKKKTEYKTGYKSSISKKSEVNKFLNFNN